MKKIGKKNKKQLSISNYPAHLIVAVIFMAVIPLLVRITMINYPMDQFNWYIKQNVFYDIYSYIKSNAIIMIGSLSFFVLIYRQYFHRNINYKDPVIIFSAMFFMLTLISHLFATNINVSSRGYLERYESVWVWLSYLSVFLLVYTSEWDQKTLNILKISFIITNMILSIVGVFQYFGIDLLVNDITKPFITALSMNGVDFNTEYTINYQVIVQSLYHYNYVGFFASLSFPLIASFALYEEKLKLKLLYVLLSLLILFNLFGSSARGGLLGLVVAIPFWIIFNRQRIFKKVYITVVLFALIATVFIGFEWYSDGFVTKRIMSTFNTVTTEKDIRNIDLFDNSIIITIKESEFKMNIDSRDDDGWEISYYLNDNPISPVGLDDNNKLYFESDQLKTARNYLSYINNLKVLVFEYQGESWKFGYTDTQTLSYVNPYGNFDIIENAQSIGFEGNEKMGSARGYIWSRTFPLILNQPLLGYGIDNFALVFPQNDYIGKYNAYDTNNMIVDKAHNMYLNIAINSGLFALASYLSLYLILGKRTLQCLATSRFNFYNEYHSGFAIALLSYFVASFFNDSTVHVSPVFWVCLAISLHIFSKDFINRKVN